MKGEQWIFFAPCSNQIATAHFQDTILKGVAFEDIKDHLKPSDITAIQGKETLRIWGNTPGSTAQRGGFMAMEIGDIILFYKNKRFTYSGKVSYKTDNEELAKKLWPDYEENNPWRFIYFLENTTEVNIPLDLIKKYSEYKPNYVVLRFQSMNAKAMSKINKEYGSVEEFIQEYGISVEPEYFILITGNEKYKDEPKKRYHFKQGIPGSKQLLNAENNGKFVYYRNGVFFGKGDIGKITSYEENGVTYYYAEVENFEELGPISFKEIRNNLSFDSVGQAGINRISKDDYKVIITPEFKPISTFAFTEKDFNSCTGKKADAQYLYQRFKTLRDILKTNLDHDLEEFTECYAARPFNQGSKKFRDHLWLGFSHKKLNLKPQQSIQFQVTIHSEKLEIEIFIHSRARNIRGKARSYLEKNENFFLEQVRSLNRYYIGCYNGEDFEVITDEMRRNTLDEFLEHMDNRNSQVYITKILNKKEAIKRGDSIVNDIYQSWKELLPIYKIMAFGTNGQTTSNLNFLHRGLELNFDELSFNPLLFEDEEYLKSQIHAALISGKNIMLVGPPGTGKTEIALSLGHMAEKKEYIHGYVLTTATSDWTTFDTIGGYVPSKDGKHLEFMPGQFLRCFKDNEEPINKWLIIDEINRSDIDKAFGQLFTVLSGQSVELPFFQEAGCVKIIPYKSFKKDEVYQNEYVVPNSWRLIATLNTYDKASLYQMSYAFMRRFAFINVSVPSKDFIDDNWTKYLEYWDINYTDNMKSCFEAVKEVWKNMNSKESKRPLGPAIIKDVLEFIASYIAPVETINKDIQKRILTHAVSAFIIPQFEGLEQDSLNKIKEQLKEYCESEKIDSICKEMFEG